MDYDYSNSDMDRLISEHIHNDRHAEILRLRLIRGFTYAKIADTVKPTLSERQISRIVSKGAAKLYRHLLAPE